MLIETKKPQDLFELFIIYTKVVLSKKLKSLLVG